MWDFLFSSIWGWMGTAGVVVLICVAVGYFFPGFRVLALEVAGGVLAAAAIYAKGNRDEAGKWNKQIDKDVQKGQKARADAERDVNSGRVRGDEWDRDKGGV
jgi:hypothetical protein